MTNIEILLSKHGPMMSSELSARLSIVESIPNNTASQKVSRCSTIEKIKGFYSSSQSYCYLKEHERDGLLYKKFIQSLYDNGRKYWYTINALKMHGGILKRNFLECYTNYPIIPLKKNLPFNVIMQKFVEQGVIVFDGDYYILSPKFNINRTTTITHKTIELIKADVLSSFTKLTKNTGLISYKTGELFAEYGKLRWAFKGVSNVTGLIKNGKSGFILADIIIGTPIYDDDIKFFIEKIKQVQSFKNATRIIPFLIVDDLDKKALLTLKQNGIVIGFIGELFGQKYAETLKELINILNNAGASLSKTPEKYFDLIQQLKIYNEGLVNNIRGALFEYMVGYIHSGKASIELGREIVVSGSRHEMDVLALNDDSVVIAECKATKSKIGIDIINKWIDVKIPAFKIWFDRQETYSKKNLCFEFWSTGGYTKEALERLDKYSSSAKVFKVKFFKAEDMRDIAMSRNNKKLKEAMDNFFLKIDV